MKACSMGNYSAVCEPMSGLNFGAIHFASDSDSWDDYEPVNDPASGQKLNPGKFASDSADNWETCDPHGSAALTPTEVERVSSQSASREATDSPTGNSLFDSLWTQAISISSLPLSVFGCGAAKLSCAKNRDGKKAIKITTARGCKVLVCPKADGGESSGLDVYLVGGAATPGVLSENGNICFAIPVETNQLVGLVRRIEKWTVSFIILFGREKAGLITQAAA